MNLMQVSDNETLKVNIDNYSGPIEVLLDLALGDNEPVAKQAADILKTQVFLYDADTSRLENSYRAGSKIALEILESYSRAEFLTNLPQIEKTNMILLDTVF